MWVVSCSWFVSLYCWFEGSQSHCGVSLTLTLLCMHWTWPVECFFVNCDDVSHPVLLNLSSDLTDLLIINKIQNMYLYIFTVLFTVCRLNASVQQVVCCIHTTAHSIYMMEWFVTLLFSHSEHVGIRCTGLATLNENDLFGQRWCPPRYFYIDTFCEWHKNASWVPVCDWLIYDTCDIDHHWRRHIDDFDVCQALVKD